MNKLYSFKPSYSNSQNTKKKLGPKKSTISSILAYSKSIEYTDATKIGAVKVVLN